jgi:hypothetical protein
VVLVQDWVKGGEEVPTPSTYLFISMCIGITEVE